MAPWPPALGWPVTKIGDRFAALEPIAQGLERYFGGVHAQAGRGLALRMDHGTQYMSDHFLNQVKFWGLAPSFAFVAQPQTNGVAERFNRTLMEQVIYGLGDGRTWSIDRLQFFDSGAIVALGPVSVEIAQGFEATDMRALGISAHGAPVLNIREMPFKTSFSANNQPTAR